MRKNNIDFSSTGSIKRSFEEIIYSQIPVTKFMGIEVSDYTKEKLTLKAPLNKNINHRFSAFGGSIYSIAVLTGYGMIFLRLREMNLNPHIVIHKSNVVYNAPIEEDFETECKIENEEEFDSFIRYYLTNKKSRIVLSTNVVINGQTVFTLNAKYVIYD